MTILVLTLLSACTGETPTPRPQVSPDTETGTTSGDTGTLVTPTGTTGDTSSTAETGLVVTTPGDWLFDEDKVLVVPDGDGLRLMANDGTVRLMRTWTELMGPRDACAGEGGSPDGDGLLLSFTTGGGFGTGAIGRIDGTLALDFRLQGFIFPHDAVRDPIDDTIIIPEASANKITWIAGDGATTAPVRVLDTFVAGWVGAIPNGIDRFEHDGRSLMLCSHRGGGILPPASGAGEITLWDITTPGDPFLVWRFPDGSLEMPHGPLFRQYQGQWWLIYAHSAGGQNGGSTVGLAVTDDPTVLPLYVAGLTPIEPIAPFIFLRGVELTSDGWLYLTDSGGRAGSSTGIRDGRVLKAPMPTLLPSGTSGGTTSGQVFVDLVGAEVLLTDLDNPFEGWLWEPVVPLPPQ